MLVLCSFFLLSCSNVGNGNRIIRHAHNTEIKASKDAAEYDKTCPIYTLPAATVAPEIPVDKIRSAANKSDGEVIAMLTKHIRDLREYISKEKREAIIHHQKYLTICEFELK